jgi:hypothetical protein
MNQGMLTALIALGVTLVAGLIVIPTIEKAQAERSIYDILSEDINGIYNNLGHNKDKVTDSESHVVKSVHQKVLSIEEQERCIFRGVEQILHSVKH